MVGLVIVKRLGVLRPHADANSITNRNGKCRLYKQFDETEEHVILSCPLVANEQYIKRHDTVCAQLHFNTCKEIGVKLENKHWYGHLSQSVETSHKGKATILWKDMCEPTELFLTMNRT